MKNEFLNDLFKFRLPSDLFNGLFGMKYVMQNSETKITRLIGDHGIKGPIRPPTIGAMGPRPQKILNA